MPLARVICRSNQEAAPLVERLESLGYRVETVRSAEPGAEVADIEIDLQSFSLVEALAEAGTFARNYADAEIYVAPGVLPADARSETAERPSALLRAIATISDGIRETQLQISKAWREAFDHALRRQEEYENQTAPPSTPPQRELQSLPATEPLLEAAATEDSVQYQSLVHPAEEEPVRSEELARQAEEQRERERQQQVREAELQRRNREAEQEVLRMAEEAAKWDQLPAQPLAIPELHSEETAVLSANKPVDEPIVAAQPVVAHGSQPEVARESQPEVVWESQPEAVPTTPILVPSVVVPSVVPNVAEQKPAQDWQPATRTIPVSAVPPTPRHVTVPRVPVGRRVREWRLAMAAAAGFAVLLMGAWSLVSNPRPAAPLTPSQIMHSSSVEEQVPFGPTTVRNKATKTIVPVRRQGHPAQVSVKPPAAKHPEGTAAARPKAATSQHSTTSQRSATSQRAATPKPSAATQRSRRNYSRDNAEDDGGDEVVIHHYTSSPANLQPTGNAQARAGIKRITDNN